MTITQALANQEVTLRKLLSQDPTDLRSTSALADVLEGERQWRAALAPRRLLLERAKTEVEVREARLNLARDLVEAGQESEAIPLLKSMLAQDNDDQAANFEMGTALARQNEFEAAVRYFLRALSLRPADAEAQLSTAKAQITLLHYADAEGHLDAIPPGTEPRKEIALLRGLVYAHTGRQAEAVAAFETAARIDPQDARVQLELGSSLKALGRNQEAVEALTRSASLQPSVEAWFQLSRLFRLLGRDEEAKHAVRMLESLEQERSNGTRVQVLRNAASAALRDGQTQKAVADLKAALQLKPNDADLTLQLALAYEKSDQSQEGRALLQRTVATGNASADMLGELGKLEVIANSSNLAKAHLEQALSKDPQNAVALTSLGVLFARENKLAEAEALLLDAVGSDPDASEAFRDLGLVEAAEGEYPQAEQALTRSLALEPASEASSLALVQVYLAQRKDLAAGALLKKTQTAHPDDPSILEALTGVALDTNDMPTATAMYARLRAVAPDRPLTQGLAEKLCSVPPALRGSGFVAPEVCTAKKGAALHR